MASCNDRDGGLIEITDTSGASFAWRCADHCRPEIEDGTPPLPPCESGSRSTRGTSTVSSTSRLPARRARVAGSRPRLPRAWSRAMRATARSSPARRTRTNVERDLPEQRRQMYPPDSLTWELADELRYAAIPREDTLDPGGPLHRRCRRGSRPRARPPVAARFRCRVAACRPTASSATLRSWRARSPNASTSTAARGVAAWIDRLRRAGLGISSVGAPCACAGPRALRPRMESERASVAERIAGAA